MSGSGVPFFVVSSVHCKKKTLLTLHVFGFPWEANYFIQVPPSLIIFLQHPFSFSTYIMQHVSRSKKGKNNFYNLKMSSEL